MLESREEEEFPLVGEERTEMMLLKMTFKMVHLKY